MLTLKKNPNGTYTGQHGECWTFTDYSDYAEHSGDPCAECGKPVDEPHYFLMDGGDESVHPRCARVS